VTWPTIAMLPASEAARPTLPRWRPLRSPHVPDFRRHCQPARH